MILFCAVLSGVADGVGMAELAEQREAWLRECWELPHGIPSPDTLRDVFGRLKPAAFAEAFLRSVPVALPSLTGEQVCLEGKTRRGRRVGENTVHLMSASAGKARLVLRPPAVADKTTEITALPDLLSRLELKRAVVSIDAMGCQKTLAEQILKAEADYLLALKDNHPPWCEDVRRGLDTEVAPGRLRPQETVEKDHGRLEIRR